MLDEYDEAVKLYNDNKALFEKLWKDGKIPNGHVPMAIISMANSAVHSNEAVFRWISPYIASLPKKNRIAALNKLKSVLSGSDSKLLDFINSDRSIKTLDQLLDKVVEDANKRSQETNASKLSLNERSILFDKIFSEKQGWNRSY